MKNLFFVISVLAIFLVSCTKTIDPYQPYVPKEIEPDAFLAPVTNLGTLAPNTYKFLGAFHVYNPNYELQTQQMIYGFTVRVSGYKDVIDSVYWRFSNTGQWIGNSAPKDEIYITLNQTISSRNYSNPVMIWVKAKNFSNIQPTIVTLEMSSISANIGGVAREVNPVSRNKQQISFAVN